jgi:Divergent InlB B-repeat domain
MNRSCIGLALGALVAVGVVLSLPSCGHDQKLVNLEIQPATFTFLEPYPTTLAEQYTAVGTYIHPPATMDVTNQATWKIDDGAVTMTAPGLFTPAPGFCGGGNISATVPGGTGGASNIMIAYATVTVDNPTVATCPGGNTEATLSVQITPNVGGTVTSLSYGINCPSVTCIAVVPVGASVALTATPNSGFSFLNWTGCTTTSGASGNVCTVTIPVGGVGLVATFRPS